MGNQVTAWGLMAAAENAGKELFLGSYPITPASDILHELAKHKHFGVKILQAEDEIASICSAIGSSFAGGLGVTTTSGPGFALKGEALGLAVMTELPLVVVNVQRGGPSTGLPTKTEQSDLLQALYGRNGESPLIVLAASTPTNCFDWAYEAAKLAMEHMTPVVLLTDGYLGNGSGPWKIKKMKDLSPINLQLASGNKTPYARDKEKLSRYWAAPGTEGLEHRVGGLEKDYDTGNISYDPLNHEKMCELREEKVARVANYLPKQTVSGVTKGDLLVVGWGGTHGSLFTMVDELVKEGKSIAHTHFNYINPLPKNTAEIFDNYKKVLVCELNKGQFVKYLQASFPEFTYDQYNKVQGLPFTTDELRTVFTNKLAE